MSERYIVSNTAVPERERDRFRKLRHSGTYRNLKMREPEVGERGVYTVELTPKEARDLQRDRPSNLRHLEADGRSYPHVDAAVPSDADLRSHEADMLFEWGFDGQGIDVGVIDDGLGIGIRPKFNIKANRDFGGNTFGTHGSPVAALALPRRAQIVFGGVGDDYLQSAQIEALNWMVSVGIHIVNMSYGGTSYSESVNESIQDAIDAGVSVFASAGNDSTSTPQYPAHYDRVRCVGALDRTAGWKRASFSNYGPWVDLWMNGVNCAAYDENGNSKPFSGTSASTPLAVFVSASLLTKGLTSIGQISTQEAVKKGSDGVPGGIGGGRRVNGNKAAFAMRDFCE